ncbi:MAG TPA: D-tyrosyl-tRNA(Tyr) deacylase [Lachnospiraceae bacterium]|jgi:D-tyrosyl-tRNA(Tyr) deacylase|nr:D-tyrosyl-tRNA(Tyr) deacylase [Lachnospiraceae bacterium]
MKFVIQRVSQAEVVVEEQSVGKIDQGLMVLVSICNSDTKEIADKLINKLIHLRIFEDENGKSNLSVQDIHGNLLIVSQFTLYADCRKGNRPSYTNAGNPDLANELYEYIIAQCQKEFPNVQHGIFGAYMKVSLLNDGPFTIIFDSEQMC